MREKIQKYLRGLEKEKGIKILLACETGSRAWGFPSPDSDYDVRLIYKHPIDWYLSLTEKKDTIEVMYEANEIDITGWDIRKTLRLLKKSNGSLLERIQSPQIYMADQKFLDGILDVANGSYSRIATIHHYLNLAKRFFDEIRKEESYKLKSFFYALRTVVACQWIMAREEIPPIEFGKMLNGLSINVEVLSRIEELIALKSTKSERYRHQGESAVFQFMENGIELAEQNAGNLLASRLNAERMDEFFLEIVL